jgi:hypothetical protein
MAASQPDIVVARAQKMLEKGTITQEQFDDVTLKMAKASEALQKIDKNLPAETKADVLPAMIEKNDLKAEKQLVDDSQHDAINEKIKIKDEEIKNIMESPSKEQIKHDDFLKGFDAEISKMSEDKPKVEIPKSENQQQLEGLIEKDDSQKSVPIELNPNVETIQEPTEQEKVDNQIALLEKAIDDMKKNEYWQEKITAQQFGERSRAIEKEINKLKKPVAIEQEKIATEEANNEKTVEQKKPSTPDGFKNNIQDGGIVLGEAVTNDHVTENGYTYRTVGDAEVSAINETGGVHSKEGKAKGGNKNIKYWSKGNGKFFYKNANSQNVIRVKNDNISSNEVVSSKNLEIWDKTKNKFVPFLEHVNDKTNKESAPLIDKAIKTEPVKSTTEKPVEKKKEPDNSSLIDEEEDTVVKDDSETVKKMLDDLEILKQYSPNNVKMDGKTGDEIKNLATKKYQGMIERAYKAKLEGKINKSTYTLFRNDANDILGPKIAEKNREVKGQIDAIKETIKEKLLGQGYKNVLLSAPGINPKTVADLIDLTADLVKRGVDAGHAVRKAVDVALNYIKNHPNYDDILSSEKIPESKFRKMFEAKIGQLESIVEQSTQEETPAEKPTEEKNTETQSNKETVDNTTKETNTVSENTSQSNEKPIIDEAPTSKEKQTKTGKRVTASEKYSKALKNVALKAFNYDSVKAADVEKYVDEQLDKFNDGLLVDLANDMINDRNPFPAKVQKVAEWKLLERLRSMSEDSSISEMDEQMLNQAAAKLAVKLSEGVNIAATVTSLQSIMAKALPLSEKGVEAFVEEKLKDVQDSYLSNNQNQEVTDIDKMVRDMVEAEINRITEGVQGKEWSDEMDAKIDSLKLDLSEC